MTLFEAYVTNAGKYADYGVDAGEILKFPTTTEEVQSLLKRIGVDGVRYQEIFIVSFDGDVLGLYDYLSEYENLDELNHLAHLLSELDQGELETLEAVLNKGDHTSSVADIINLVHNLDCYDLHPGVSDDETLGRIYVEDMGLLEVPENLINYFDFEAYGRDMRLNEGGHFAPGGYLTRVSNNFVELYHGIEDIPAEHRVFAYGRMLEIYMLTSLAPIPVATLSNREVGQMGQNYLKSLFAVGFQGLLILLCVGIYGVLVQGISTSGDPIGAIWGCVGYTVLLCFMLFKTGSISKSIFGAH